MDALYEPDARDEAFELIRSLIEQVVLTPVEGELSIDLHGEIAGILSICDDRIKPASSTKSVNGGAKRDHLGGVRRDRLAAAGLSP